MTKESNNSNTETRKDALNWWNSHNSPVQYDLMGRLIIKGVLLTDELKEQIYLSKYNLTQKEDTPNTGTVTGNNLLKECFSVLNKCGCLVDGGKHIQQENNTKMINLSEQGRELLDIVNKENAQLNEQLLSLQADNERLREALKYVLETIEENGEWWIDCPNKGGFDTEKIEAALQNK